MSRVYEAPDEECTRYVISPPLRARSDQEALWAALGDGRLDLIATDSVPDHLANEKVYTGPVVRHHLQRLTRHRDAAAGGLGQGSGERAPDPGTVRRPSWRRRRRESSGCASKGAIEVGKDADLVLIDRDERWTIRAADQHHSSDFTLFEGIEVRGRVKRTIVRGEDVVRNGRFVGQRGHGQFQARSIR